MRSVLAVILSASVSTAFATWGSDDHSTHSRAKAASAAIGVGIGKGGNAKQHQSLRSTNVQKSYSSSNQRQKAISGSFSEGGNAKGGSAKSLSKGGSSNQSQGANNDVHISDNSSTVYEAMDRPVAGAYAPGLVAAGNEMCVGSVSAGGQGAAFGFSIGSTVKDKDCIRRKDARFIANLGFRKAACELMAQKDSVANAFASAGYDCDMKVFIQKKAQAKRTTYTFTDGN